MARQLAEQGIVVISELTLGVDGVAHAARLDGGSITVAILAGTILSEYPAGTPGYPSNFIARNRIVAEKSGTPHTARFALEQEREVLAVPGNITSLHSARCPACATVTIMKLMISLGLLIFSSLGGWLGTVLDHGNGFGGWAILLTALGGFFGIWAGYKIAKNYF